MVSPGLVTPTVSVDTTNGHWTYTYPAQNRDYYLLGFSYEYYLMYELYSALYVAGDVPAAGISSLATFNLNTCIPDDVECKVAGLHFARYSVPGSLSGSFSSTTTYVFDYGKTLKTPVFIPKGSSCSLESKINDFFGNLNGGHSTLVDALYYLCQLNPGTARMLIK